MAEDLAEFLLIYRAVFNAPLDGFNEVLNYIKIILIVFKILFWSPFSKAFNFSRFKDTVLLGVSNYLISFINFIANSV